MLVILVHIQALLVEEASPEHRYELYGDRWEENHICEREENLLLVQLTYGCFVCVFLLTNLFIEQADSNSSADSQSEKCGCILWRIHSNSTEQRAIPKVVHCIRITGIMVS